ncbi:hypothetical protein C0995_008081, partial [Termitomyces sp. Mi166
MSKITFTLAGNNTFTLEGDTETIAAYLATQLTKTEFAGLASDTPPPGSLDDVEALEFD